MTTPSGAGTDHYLAHPYATVQLWRWATVRTDVVGTTTDQGDALRTNDDLALLVYLDTVGSPSDRFPRVVASAVTGPAFVPGDVAYLALTCFTETFGANPPGQVILRVTEVVAGQAGKPHHVAVPAAQGALVTTTVLYEPIIADGPRTLRLELMGEDNPRIDCRVWVTRLALTTYAPLASGGTTRQTSGSSRPKATLTATGFADPNVRTASSSTVAVISAVPTAPVGAAGSGGVYAFAPVATGGTAPIKGSVQPVASQVVPPSNSGANLRASARFTPSGFSATATARGRDGIKATTAMSATAIQGSSAGANLRATARITATGTQVTQSAQTQGSRIRATAQPVSPQVLPRSNSTATLRAKATLSGSGFSATATARGESDLKASTSGQANFEPVSSGRATLRGRASLQATGRLVAQVGGSGSSSLKASVAPSGIEVLPPSQLASIQMRGAARMTGFGRQIAEPIYGLTGLQARVASSGEAPEAPAGGAILISRANLRAAGFTRTATAEGVADLRAFMSVESDLSIAINLGARLISRSRVRVAGFLAATGNGGAFINVRATGQGGGPTFGQGRARVTVKSLVDTDRPRIVTGHGLAGAMVAAAGRLSASIAPGLGAAVINLISNYRRGRRFHYMDATTAEFKPGPIAVAKVKGNENVAVLGKPGTTVTVKYVEGTSELRFADSEATVRVQTGYSNLRGFEDATAVATTRESTSVLREVGSTATITSGAPATADTLVQTATAVVAATEGTSEMKMQFFSEAELRELEGQALLDHAVG